MKKLLCFGVVIVMALVLLAACEDTQSNSGSSQSDRRSSQSDNRDAQSDSRDAQSDSRDSQSDSRSSKSAKDYLDAHDAADLEQIIEMSRSMGMELSITTSGDMIIYTYRYLEEMDAEVAREYFNTMSDMLKEGSDVVIKEMNDFGVGSPAVRYVYQNLDGSEIWSGDFK
jgi:hypothetical protein